MIRKFLERFAFVEAWGGRHPILFHIPPLIPFGFIGAWYGNGAWWYTLLGAVGLTTAFLIGQEWADERVSTGEWAKGHWNGWDWYDFLGGEIGGVIGGLLFLWLYT